MLGTLSIHHTAGLTTAVDLPDLGTVIQIDLSVLVPGVGTTACTIDRRIRPAILIMLLLDRRTDIDFTIERTAFLVVTTIDGTLQQFVAHGVIYQVCIITMSQIVHVGLIDITRLKGLTTISTAEDTTNLDGRAFRHIHHGATGNTLLVATTIGGANPTTHQIDDS